ncbi:hypothetical protein L3X38_029771 [Prunus dulcis]|uniref:Uncharacterized protein n=1 Tax=Prunus dulcis TaxID=3755 RepID=A0AAD4VTK7_PRUDU|nr:hypothetical protein L3X38_029771 [Prunus dulcis]
MRSIALRSSPKSENRFKIEDTKLPRKPKNEDAKPDNSGPVVRHQKLCLSIDIDKRRIYGYTELKISVPEIGIVGLHARKPGD